MVEQGKKERKELHKIVKKKKKGGGVK